MDKTIGITLLFFFLNSCSSYHTHKDGAPAYDVDETKIKDAVPKVLPLAKYGNMPFYHVLGRTYYVMPVTRTYDEVGIASWYGTQFHQKRTSSGEPYNMLAMTAAHKTLPLPSYVQVTNLYNHKKVIVKVNDRGPFASGRIIDLSYVAAKKLGMIGHGTAKVRVSKIYPKDSRPFPKDSQPLLFAQNASPFARLKNSQTHNQAIPPVGDYRSVYLQVGAFREKENAWQFRDHLLTYFKASIKVNPPSALENWYRVQVGPFKDMPAAEKMIAQLRNLGIKSNKKYGT